MGRRDQLRGLLLRDDRAPSAPDKAKLRFLDAAFDLPAVDIAVAGAGAAGHPGHRGGHPGSASG